MKKYIWLLLLLPVSIFASEPKSLKVELQKEYIKLVNEHNRWLRKHKHENNDVHYYYRLGRLDTYVKILEKL